MERKNGDTTNREGLSFRLESRSAATTSSDFVLQWGNRKRSRCTKVPVKDHNGVSNVPTGSGRATARVERRPVRSDLNNNNNNNTTKDAMSNKHNNSSALRSNGGGNLRHRPASPSPSTSHRILRNSENPIGMRGQNSNGVKGLASQESGERKGPSVSNNNINGNKNSNSNNNHHGGGGDGSGSSETAHDDKKGVDTVLPKFVIALTNKEKEDDFMILKGSKLPQRPKKRAKLIQRTLNFVSPGTWLCDLTLDRYEVREKKASKKKPRGLKAMGNIVDSDSDR